MPERQYLTAKFKPWDRRDYTYHNDGEPVQPGDSILVDTNKGRQTITVERVGVPKPTTFDTKAIVGKAPTIPAEKDSDPDPDRMREDRDERAHLAAEHPDAGE